MLRSVLRMVVVTVALLALPGVALAQVQPYGTNDYGGFRNVLPPGTNGFDNLAQAAQFETAKTYPPHANDQLGMYSALTTAAPNIRPRRSGCSSRTPRSACPQVTWPRRRAPSPE